ncbi:MAG: hypothetical protein A3F16_08280 [Deltaproteobacteria bacterium RIFCSPHIGHO2_12_FULL_43_9]|nr:MAG: hypothetical protein A3F16_08280 [Deltaproteobacteria bacterium RIFCSPHIGHO2_12_FULL_43_9]
MKNVYSFPWLIGTLISFIPLILLLPSCNNSNPNPDQSNSAGYSYPHADDWEVEHMAFLTSPTASINADTNRCSVCHSVMKKKSKAMTTTCAVKCHSPSDGTDPKPLPKPISNECSSCHAKYFDPEQMGNLHYPSGVGLCRICHTPQPSHLDGTDKKGVTTETNAESCYRCHDRQDTMPKVHPALSLYDDSCILCHNPHGGNKRYFINAGSTAELCTQCHDIKLNNKSIHGVIVTDKECVNCHTPHSGAFDKLLHVEPTSLCLSCHDKEIPTSDGSRVIPNIKQKVTEMPFTHSAITYGTCNDCHSPHSSEHNRLLVAEYSIENYNKHQKDTYALCFMCHDDRMLKKGISTTETNFRNDVAKGVSPSGDPKIDSFNLHWYHVVDASGDQNKSRGRACRICHDPHGSSQMFNINPFWKIKQSPVQIVFSHHEDDLGGECTKTCHSTRIYRRMK